MRPSAILLAGFVASTQAYVVTLFNQTGCTGGTKEVNVWDNTCAEPHFDTWSLRVEVFGGSEQKADIYFGSGCWPHERVGSWYADKGNFNTDLGTWSLGECASFGRKMYSFGSRGDPTQTWFKRDVPEGTVGRHFVA